MWTVCLLPDYQLEFSGSTTKHMLTKLLFCISLQDAAGSTSCCSLVLICLFPISEEK